MLAQPPIWFILIAFVSALGPLIVIHELGHYWVARLFGVGAEVFSIGFGREIFGWTDKRGTRWKVGWLPLGGYVRFVGDDNEASAPAADRQLTAREKELSFHLKPVGQRFLIVLAGPMANFALAILIFVAFFATMGAPRTSNVVSALQQGSPAQAAGIKVGDRVVAIANRSTPTFEDVAQVVLMRPTERVPIVVERGGRTLELQAVIGVHQQVDRFGQRYRIGRIGIYGGLRKYERLPAIELLPAAASYTVRMTRSMIDGLWQIISGRRSAKDLGGPVKIAQIAGQQASLGFADFILLVALLSINLGFINLLPVPMLDGGHLVFYAIEAVRRRPVSAKALDWAFRGGLALILALLVFVTINDLGSLGLWNQLERLIG
jgi:regulator of sigma E protease